MKTLTDFAVGASEPRKAAAAVTQQASEREPSDRVDSSRKRQLIRVPKKDKAVSHL